MISVSVTVESSSVSVPQRVLTAEFCNGCKINNLEEIKRQGLSLKDVSKTLRRDFNPGNAEGAKGIFICQTADKLIRTFAEQIFYTGFIHADPHPGNGGSIIQILHWYLAPD